MQPTRDQARATVAHQDMLDKLDEVRRAVLGEFVDNITFKGQMLKSCSKRPHRNTILLLKTEKYYSQAIIRMLWTDIVGSLDVDSPEAYLDIEVRFALLNIICPDYIKPPANPINPAEVERIVMTLNNALGDLLLLPLFE